VEEQDKIETEDTDVAGHKLAARNDSEADAADGRTRHASDESESDDPDIEGHKLMSRHASDEGDDPDVEGHKLMPKHVPPKTTI
jgi:hypothetical protein